MQCGQAVTEKGRPVAAHLGGHGVGLANLVSPVTPPDGHHRHLGLDDGPTDGCSHLHTFMGYVTVLLKNDCYV